MISKKINNEESYYLVIVDGSNEQEIVPINPGELVKIRVVATKAPASCSINILCKDD